MTNLLFSLLSVPAFLINIALCFAPFSRLVSKKAKRLLHCGCFALSVFAAIVFYAAAMLGLASIVFLRYAIFLTMLLTGLLQISVLHRQYLREYLFSTGLATLLNYTNASLAVFLTYYFGGWNSAASWVCVEVLTLLLEAIFYCPIRRLIVDTVRPFLAVDNRAYIRSVWMIPLALLLTCCFSLPGSRHVMYFREIVSRFFLGIAALSVCRGIAVDYSRIEEAQTLAEQLNMQKHCYSELRLEIEKTHRQRHDLKHHLAAIQHYLEINSIEALREYCGELLAQSDFHSPLPYSGNGAADGVIYHYMKRSQEHCIRFTYQGTICSEGIADTDLCVLLGNALDNAFAGCLTLQQTRFICVTTQSEKQLLSILIQNSFDGIVAKNQKGIQSRKQDHTGIGLNSMETICQRYGGTIEHSWEENTFTVCMLLPLHPKSG